MELDGDQATLPVGSDTVTALRWLAAVRLFRTEPKVRLIRKRFAANFQACEPLKIGNQSIPKVKETKEKRNQKWPFLN